MIDISNATLKLTEPAGRLGITVFRATLELYSEAEMDNQFLGNSDAMKSLREHLKRDLQHQIYGELIEKILVAHRCSLRAAQIAGTFEEVKAVFQDIVDLLRLHKVPYDTPSDVGD